MSESVPINAPPDWRPLRIAVTGGRGIPSNYSGVERICEQMFCWLADRGHKVTVYCRPSVLKEKMATYKGVRLVRTAAPGGKKGETLSHGFTSILHAALHGDVHDGGRSFDLLSVHTIAPAMWTPIAYMANLPVITHVHGLDHQREKWKGLGSKVIRLAEQVMVRASDYMGVVNPSIGEYYMQKFGVPSMVLPNGVPAVPDAFTPDTEVLQRFGIQPGKYVVCVGRLVPEKRYQDTIRAFATLDTDHKLVIVGDGPHTLDYVNELKALGAQDPKGRVVFTGLQTGTALETLFRCAALYVSASELEGNPMSVLECMERRVPAVLSDITGHRPLFPRGTYELLFNVGDVGTLAEKIAFGLHQRDIVTDLADRCRTHIRKEFGWPALAEKTEQLYLRVVHAREAGIPVTA